MKYYPDRIPVGETNDLRGNIQNVQYTKKTKHGFCLPEKKLSETIIRSSKEDLYLIPKGQKVLTSQGAMVLSTTRVYNS